MKNGAKIMFDISKYRRNGVGYIKISLKLCRIHRLARCFDVQLGGMDITNGRAELGGGIYISESSNSTFERCLIMGNTAVDKGGAMYFGKDSTVELLQMELTLNHAKLGGGMFLEQCTGSHDKIRVERNTASIAGGGIFLLNQVRFSGSNSSVSANEIWKSLKKESEVGIPMEDFVKATKARTLLKSQP